jgi:hypothetical protein
MARGNGVVVFIWREEEAVYCDGSFCRKFVSLLGCSKEQKRLVPLGVFGDLLRETLFTQVKYFYAAVFLLLDSMQKGIACLIRFASFSSACREMICFACSKLSRHMQRGARPEAG